MRLADLIARGIGREARGEVAAPIRGVRHDSRQVEPGDLFVAIAGQRARGSEFAADAVARGALAIAAEAFIEGLDVPQLRVDDARIALALASHAVYGDPTAELVTIGVTGTNGKTTTTWLVDEALAALGARPALLGTVETRGPGVREASAMTTPEADTIARFARSMRNAGATHLVMEVSSHALALRRVDGIHFDVAAFTNLSRDHLDFHGTMEAYFEAKKRLFVDLAPRCAVVCIDDPWGAELARALPSPLTVSRHHETASFHATRVAIDRNGVRADVRSPAGPFRIESPLLGAHNLDNLLVAAACLVASGVAPRDAGEALRGARGAPGRLERVADPRDVAVLVDYAHSPDALANVLDALRPLTPGRLICVFGCGGDRDRGKRPRMGEAAASRADLAIVTSDNPRTEDPRAIIEMIVPGVEHAGLPRINAAALGRAARGYVVEVDRRTAIALAVAAAHCGDTVLIAGKGHEDYQILGTTKIAFDDRVEARRAIESAVAGARC
jgi:UDP-N-acetylmuramoyl-L-alanyl-D-glutamate--2,6-diaminopimelate ligase